MRTIVTATLFCLLLICLPVGSSLACTCFCFNTPDGPVFGANLDLFIPGDGLVFVNRRGIAKEGFDPGTTGITTKWVSKYGSISFNTAGRLFAYGGMNEAGLVVGGMELRASEYPEPDDRPPLTLGTWVQYVLDTCGSIEDVIQVDSKVRIEDSVSPSHFLISDAEGNCVGIEWMDGHLVYYTAESLPVKAMSNMPYDRALAAYERGGPRWWWSNPGQSAERFAGAADRCESFNASSDTDAVNYAFGTLTHVVAAPHTKWNLVYDIAKREIWYRSAASPTVKHLSFSDFDFSCGAPLLMLDINAALEGDVKQSFMPYDHDINLKVFTTLCARLGIEVSADEVNGMMRLIESFECVR